MELMLRRYVQRLAAGQSNWDAEDAPGPNGTVTRNDAAAAAYQLAGYIAATTDPRVTPDPGAAAANLMIMIEYIAPQAADLDPAPGPRWRRWLRPSARPAGNLLSA